MEGKKFDDGSSLHGLEYDYDPTIRNRRHYSEQLGHLARGFSNKFGEIRPDRITTNFMRRNMRRVSRDGRN